MRKLLIVYKISSTFGLIFLTLFCFSQNNICDKKSTDVFWPIKIAAKAQYYSQALLFTSYFNGDSIHFDGNIFYKEIKKYVNGKTDTTYFREQEGNVFIYDSQKKLEFLELSKNITPGYTWKKYDESWKYTVLDTTSTFSTPYCQFKNLLNIKAEPQNKKAKLSYYNLYFKRGIGLVGLKVSGEMAFYYHY